MGVRKGSDKWLATIVAAGGTLASRRISSASPWHHAVEWFEGDERKRRERDVTESQIARLTERSVLRPVLDPGWNDIAYVVGDALDSFLDTDEVTV